MYMSVDDNDNLPPPAADFDKVFQLGEEFEHVELIAHKALARNPPRNRSVDDSQSAEIGNQMRSDKRVIPVVKERIGALEGSVQGLEIREPGENPGE